VLLFVSLAFATDPGCVPASLDALRLDLDGVEAALRDADGDEAARRLGAAVDAWPCSAEPAYPHDVARMGRLAALVAWSAGDVDEMARWARLWQSVDPTVGPMMRRGPNPEGFVAAVGAIALPAVATGAGQGIVPPKRGLVTMDGVPAWSADALPDTPHLVQVWDRRGQLVSGVWQEGADFDAALLGSSSDRTLPDWWVMWVETRPAPPAPPAPVAVEPGERSSSERPVRQRVSQAPAPPPVVARDPAQAPRTAHPGATGGEAPTAGVGGAPNAGRARRAPCPWGEGDPTEVEVRRRDVLIEGTAWSVRHPEDQARLRAAFVACQEFRAARRLDRWDEARGKLFSHEARDAREALARLLLEPEPDRPGKRGRRAALAPAAPPVEPPAAVPVAPSAPVDAPAPVDPSPPAAPPGSGG
jgi:hypothetical protein